MLTSMRVPHTGRAAASREGHPFGVVKSWERLTREHWNLETVVATVWSLSLGFRKSLFGCRFCHVPHCKLCRATHVIQARYAKTNCLSFRLVAFHGSLIPFQRKSKLNLKLQNH
uniref:Uncharacterized protein n=1 Tax=Aegilops tauschii subsp. strangulata TaxID=200361 RepID=A0A453T334_AEGTS